jgi:hypothetical protein
MAAMKHVETDSQTGIELWQLVEDPRPVDNIYGEQPYADATGRYLALRFYPGDGREGELAILDLQDGSLRTIQEKMPRFPAFHGWGEHLYGQEEVDGRLVLRRWDYRTGAVSDVVDLPSDMGRLSYGAVSPDGRWYAVSVTRDADWCVLRIDLTTGKQSIAVTASDRLFKHEQFAADGSNRLLIQANQMPGVATVLLGVIEMAGSGVRYIAADRPHTPRPTGHEAWVGGTDRVLFSTGSDPGQTNNVWITGIDAPAPRPACASRLRFGHVSVSRYGRYWIGDAVHEPGIPIHVGSVERDALRPVVVSGTQHDGQQWSHTHPYLTADNRWLIFTSNRGGHPQVYGAKIPAGYLDL